MLNLVNNVNSRSLEQYLDHYVAQYLIYRLIYSYPYLRYILYFAIKPKGVLHNIRLLGEIVILKYWWSLLVKHISESDLSLLVMKSPVRGKFPTQRPATRSFDVFFDLRLNKRLIKQSRSWLFETLSCPLWCQRNELKYRSRTYAEF